MKLQRLLSLTRQAVDEFHMIEEGDKIAVGISGGKDSLTLLYALSYLQRFYPKHFTIEAITVHPGYEGFDLSPVQALCDELEVPYTIVHTQISEILFEARKESHPCALCAKLRKGAFNEKALELGCNKIALGHHYDDVIETILMGMLYSGKIETMMPKLHSTNFEGMELIRPMYLIKEADIIGWRDYNQLNFIQCACRFTENCATCGGGRGSKRDEMKELIAQFREESNLIEKNIFRSVHNVNLRTIIGYHKDDDIYNFLDDYDERGKKKHEKM